MTQLNLLEQAQQGDPQAIAALMNQSLQPRGMTATVERAGDSLSVLLEADQVPNRQTLTAFVQRGISNLGIESIRSVKVLGQQSGTNLPVWTQDLTLELPTTAADAIDAVDLSPAIDSKADLSLTDTLTDTSTPTDTSDDDELEALWIAPSEEQSQDSLADLLAEEPTDDLQGLFDDQPEEFEPEASMDNPLEDLRSMFGEQSEADFPPLEESSFNEENVDYMGTPENDSLQDLFGEDLEADPLSDLNGMFSEARFAETSLGLENELDNDLDRDLLDLDGELGLGASNSDSLADLFGDRSPDEDLGMVEEIPPDEEEFQDLFGGESISGTTSDSGATSDSGTTFEAEELESVLEEPSLEAIAPQTGLSLDSELPADLREEFESDEELISFLGREPFGEDDSLVDDSRIDEIDEKPAAAIDEQLTNFLEQDLSLDLSFLEEPPRDETFFSDRAEDNALPSFSGQEHDQPEDLSGERFAEYEEEVSEPLLFNEPLDQSASFDDFSSVDQSISFSELDPPLADRSNIPPKSFQEQQALADFFADDPLADFLAQPVQPPGEEFLEGGLDDQALLSQTFQPESEPTDLFSERIDSLEAEFPQNFQANPLNQPDRNFLTDDDDTASSDNWDGGLENPLPDVEVTQADTVSSLESLTDDPNLADLQTEPLLGSSSFDRYSEPELDSLPPQPDRWDFDSDDEPTAIESPLPSTVGASEGSPRANTLEDLTISLPNLPDDGYEQHVAYPSLNDPTQAPPQPKKSPWIFPLVLFGLVGWILALIGFSYWLKERDTPQPPIVQPSAGSPVPSVPPAPTQPASPSSALPNVEDSAVALPENSELMAVD